MQPTHIPLRTKWDEHYRTGPTPWDTGITPPEVQQFWDGRTVPVGAWALDVGCGTGLNVQFLAGMGLRALGVDVSGRALNLARRRCIERWQTEAGQIETLSPLAGMFFTQADVSRLPIGPVEAVYALDIGCLHGLPRERRPDYADGIKRVLSPGGYYHLFAFDRQENGTIPARDRGMAAGEVAALFGPALRIVTEEQGKPEPHPCRWYLLQKQ